MTGKRARRFDQEFKLAALARLAAGESLEGFSGLTQYPAIYFKDLPNPSLEQ
jgi:hypothetical protein